MTNVTARAVKQSQPTLDNLVYGPQQLGSYHPSPGRHEMCCVGAGDICITLLRLREAFIKKTIFLLTFVNKDFTPSQSVREAFNKNNHFIIDIPQ